VQYSVKAAAQATGVSAGRLRTWERRYGIPSPARSDSGRRLYSEADVVLIRRMAALVDSGLPAASAAEALRDEASGGEAVPAARPVELAHPLVAALVAAAVGYDERRAVGTIREALALGSGPAFEQVLFPALADLGRGWQRGEISLTAEHFASELVRRETMAAISQTEVPQDLRGGALLACPEDERHDLALAALFLLLRETGMPTIYLGADVPAHDLVEVAHTLEAATVVLSVTAPTSVLAAAEAGRLLISSRSQAQLFVGGPALAFAPEQAALVPGRRLPASLSAAAEVVSQLVARPVVTRTRPTYGPAQPPLAAGA